MSTLPLKSNSDIFEFENLFDGGRPPLTDLKRHIYIEIVKLSETSIKNVPKRGGSITYGLWPVFHFFNKVKDIKIMRIL